MRKSSFIITTMTTLLLAAFTAHAETLAPTAAAPSPAAATVSPEFEHLAKEVREGLAKAAHWLAQEAEKIKIRSEMESKTRNVVPANSNESTARANQALNARIQLSDNPGLKSILNSGAFANSPGLSANATGTIPNMANQVPVR